MTMDSTGVGPVRDQLHVPACGWRAAVEMTMNVYGYVNLEAQRAALDHLDEQLSD